MQSLIAMLIRIASPQLFAILVFLTSLCLVLGLASRKGSGMVKGRLNGYLDRPAPIDDERSGSFVQRIVVPSSRKLLRSLGKLAPNRAMAATGEMLAQAGLPGGLGVLDYYGLRVLLAAGTAAGAFWFMLQTKPFVNALLGGAAAGMVAAILPNTWVRSKITKRRKEIERALPNCLDMLTIGVQAGLGFDAAILRVSQQWQNALTEEFRQTLREIRVGTPRDVALKNLAERTGVADLKTFVAVLAQSSQLGVSVAEVLQSQADEIRKKRRQRAQAQARQASTKMAFPLVGLVFPSMFVVILGPTVPNILKLFA